MAKKKTAKAKTAPKAAKVATKTTQEPKAGYPEMTVEDAALFELGRYARRNGVGMAESPHPKGHARDTWVKGWKFQDRART